ncbi:MAG: FAD-dependent oxidoreductase, partial [Cytophagales bacterium]|nr:FAD-dependent oxidoreductase [Cytophagales bacterium]
MKFLLLLVPLLLLSNPSGAQSRPVRVDVRVYGGTSAGVIAACTAKKMGKSVLLIEPGRHLGVLTSGGLGHTDIGNKYTITGLALDYYRRLGKHYGTFEQWIFEPGVAENLFRDYVKRAGVEVLFEHRLAGASKDANGYLQTIALENAAGTANGTNRTVKAGMFIDATYEGDLLAKAGVSYTVGREDNSLYRETLNGVQFHDKHQLPDGVDPYKGPGNPESGLVWGVSTEHLQPNGTGDKKVQAYNFRICLTSDPANLIPIARPRNYDSTRYELVLRQLVRRPAKNLNAVLKMDLMP